MLYVLCVCLVLLGFLYGWLLLDNFKERRLKALEREYERGYSKGYWDSIFHHNLSSIKKTNLKAKVVRLDDYRK